MSNQWTQLNNANKVIGKLLLTRVVGTADNPRRLSTIDLALEHAEAWAGIAVPRDGERGGSSNPRAVEEAQEIRRVHTLAVKAVDRIPEITRELERLARELHDTVQRLTSTVDPKKLPKQEVLPGCRSCLRKEERDGLTLGGHFSPVYEKAKNSGLCRWCYDVKAATGQWPAVKAVDLYHRQGARAASKWMASSMAKSA